MRDHVVGAITQHAMQDDSILLVTGDLGFGVLNEFRERCPDQFINAGVAEQNMTGLAAGLALEGFKVFTYSIANFPTLRCLEQLRNDVCYHNANVTVIAVGGGFSYGSLGMSHHATEDLSIMRSLPNMRVLAPSSKTHAAAAVTTILESPAPGYLRVDKSDSGVSRGDDNVFEIGKARSFASGDDVTIIGVGGILAECISAREQLETRGLSVGLMEMPTVKPIDEAAITRVAASCQFIATVEEHSVIGGLGGAVAEVLASTRDAARLVRIGLEDRYSSIVGSQHYLRQEYGMDAAAIVDRVTRELSS